MIRGKSRKRKPDTPDYGKRFRKAAAAFVAAAGLNGICYVGFNLSNQTNFQVQTARTDIESTAGLSDEEIKKTLSESKEQETEPENTQYLKETDETSADIVPESETSVGEPADSESSGETEPVGEEAVVTALGAEADTENMTIQNGRTVAIDAGHQAKGNSDKEPVGPGSSTMKAKVASGTVGVSTKLPEYELTLSVSKKLKRILEERGYKVVMIRETNDVNLSNAERAEIANKSGASVFVRLHGNSLDNNTIAGTLSMCQTASNPYNGELHAASYSLSKKITDAVSAATGFKNRGVQETDSMSGINWSKIPVCIVEMGFMSNPEEDQKMAQDDYQELIAAGIANGIDAYYQ